MSTAQKKDTENIYCIRVKDSAVWTGKKRDIQKRLNSGEFKTIEKEQFDAAIKKNKK